MGRPGCFVDSRNRFQVKWERLKLPPAAYQSGSSKSFAQKPIMPMAADEVATPAAIGIDLYLVGTRKAAPLVMLLLQITDELFRIPSGGANCGGRTLASQRAACPRNLNLTSMRS